MHLVSHCPFRVRILQEILYQRKIGSASEDDCDSGAVKHSINALGIIHPR